METKKIVGVLFIIVIAAIFTPLFLGSIEAVLKKGPIWPVWIGAIIVILFFLAIFLGPKLLYKKEDEEEDEIIHMPDINKYE